VRDRAVPVVRDPHSASARRDRDRVTAEGSLSDRLDRGRAALRNEARAALRSEQTLEPAQTHAQGGCV
jgi:hypothetical protein